MKTCILTGGSSGIGKETAIRIGKSHQFDYIALVGRDIKSLKKTVESMGPYVKTSIWEVDLSDPRQIPDVVSNIFMQYKSIDCLLNIAGYTDPQPLLTTSLENMYMTYNVNVFSPFVFIREVVKYMKEQGGKILNVASTAGMSARPGWLSYASSKAAMISLSQTLTEELAEYGIKVYCVSPGRCATKLRKRLAPNEDSTKIMQPQEVAEIICKLISDNEHCLDGQNIVIRKK